MHQFAIRGREPPAARPRSNCPDRGGAISSETLGSNRPLPLLTNSQFGIINQPPKGHCRHVPKKREAEMYVSKKPRTRCLPHQFRDQTVIDRKVHYHFVSDEEGPCMEFQSGQPPRAPPHQFAVRDRCRIVARPFGKCPETRRGHPSRDLLVQIAVAPPHLSTTE
jgi:hypothetical protein